MGELRGRQPSGLRPDTLAAKSGEPTDGGQAVDIDPDKVSLADLKAIIDPNFLMAINLVEERDGKPPFHFVLVDDLAEGVPAKHIGWTDLQTRTIYWAKSAVVRMLQEGKIGREGLRGLAQHEGGHHAPEIWGITELLMQNIGKVDLEPAELGPLFADETEIVVRTEKGLEKMSIGALRRKKYWQAVFSDCFNGSLDFLLEAYITRGAMATMTTGDMRALHAQSVEGRDFEPHSDPETGEPVKYGFWERLPRHHQLTQWLVGEQAYYKANVKMPPQQRRRMLIERARQHLHPDVAKVVVSLNERNIFDALRDMEVYDNWRASTPEYEATRKKKAELVMGHMYQEWLKLFLLEFEEQKEKREQEEQAKQDGKPEPGEDGEPSGGKPLSDGQKRQIAEDLMDALLGKTKELGDDAYGSDTMIPDQDAAKGKKFDGVVKQGTGRGKDEAKPGDGTPPKPDAMRDDAAKTRQGLRELNRQKIGELADRYGVDQEAVREFQRIEREYGDVVVMLAEQIAEVFVQQRTPIIERARREGAMTPGLEHVVVGGIMHGQRDLEVFEQIIETTEFMQTEFAALIDTSGSMQNARLEMGRIMVIVITLAFMKVKEILAGALLLDPTSEDPLRTEINLFADKPMRLKRQSDPNDEAWLARMIAQSKTFSGGTDDAAAVDALNSEFSKGEDRVLKFLAVVSDGEGNPAAMKGILEGMEGDERMFVVVIAMGATAGAVAETYRTEARDAGRSNVFVLDDNDVRQNIMKLAQYMIGHVKERAEEMAG